MYTDETILTWGEHKFTSLCRVPADYLLKLYYNHHQDKELMKYVEDNLEKIIARKEGRLKAPPIGLDFKVKGEKVQIICPDTNKIVLISEKAAKAELKRIHNFKNHDKKPTRAYECEKCGGWHLTSLAFEDFEKIIENK